jgi:hypothetical protein
LSKSKSLLTNRSLNQFGATDDFDCYGYECVKKLTAAQNIQHADSYMHFVGGMSPLSPGVRDRPC